MTATPAIKSAVKTFRLYLEGELNLDGLPFQLLHTECDPNQLMEDALATEPSIKRDLRTSEGTLVLFNAAVQEYERQVRMEVLSRNHPSQQDRREQ